MPITIDEVTAEVAAPVEEMPREQPEEPRPPAPSELRQLREHFERRHQRECRVKAD